MPDLDDTGPSGFPASPAVPATRHGRLARFLPYGIILIAVFAAFGRTILHGLLDWDDLYNIRDNPVVAHPSWDGFARLWAQPYGDLYVPLFYSSLILDNILGGGRPAIFHATNVLIHAVAACFVYGVVERLLTQWHIRRQLNCHNSKIPTAALVGALVFALHPLQAEPVSWITGRKDLLAGLFSIAAIWFFLLWLERPKLAPYAAATACFLLALASKPTAVAVPVMAAALLLEFRHRARRGALFLLPWVALAAAWAMWCSHIQSDYGVEHSPLPSWKRLFLAADSFLFYIQKLFFPMNLVPIYPRTLENVFATPAVWLKLPLVIAGLAAAVLHLNIYAVSVVWYACPLLPVLGIVPFYYQSISTVADRYMYLSFLGAGVATGAAVLQLRKSMRYSRLVSVATFCFLVLLGVMSWRQCGYWKDSQTLWTRELSVYPHNVQAHLNLGTAYAEQRRWAKAKSQFEAAISEDPDFARAYSNLLLIAQARGLQTEARKTAREIVNQFGHLRETTDSVSGNSVGSVEKFSALGDAYLVLQDFKGAIWAYRGALQGEPDNARHWDRLASAYMQRNDFTSAEAALRNCLRHDERSADTHVRLAICLLEQQRNKEANMHIERALALNPRHQGATSLLEHILKNQ